MRERKRDRERWSCCFDRELGPRFQFKHYGPDCCCWQRVTCTTGNGWEQDSCKTIPLKLRLFGSFLLSVFLSLTLYLFSLSLSLSLYLWIHLFSSVSLFLFYSLSLPLWFAHTLTLSPFFLFSPSFSLTLSLPLYSFDHLIFSSISTTFKKISRQWNFYLILINYYFSFSGIWTPSRRKGSRSCFCRSFSCWNPDFIWRDQKRLASHRAQTSFQVWYISFFILIFYSYFYFLLFILLLFYIFFIYVILFFSFVLFCFILFCFVLKDILT